MAKRVLLLNEDESVQFAYQKVLQREQCEVVTSVFHDGFQRLSGPGSYDVIIIDLPLRDNPEDRDFELILQASHMHADSVIIVTSDNSSSELQHKAHQAGAKYFFEKPVSTNRIREALIVSGVLSSADISADRKWLSTPVRKSAGQLL